MAASNGKKRRLDEAPLAKIRKKVRKQKFYSSPSPSSASPSADEFGTTKAAEPEFGETEEDLSESTRAQTRFREQSDTSSASRSDSESERSESSNPNHVRVSKSNSKRNDPNAFATSISAILASKLSTSKRSDPVLARSAAAAEANMEIANSKLEAKAKRKMKSDRRDALDRGRVKNVLLGTKSMGDNGLASANEQDDEGGVTAGETQELEKRLRKTAQRGVVKLFNAVRQAQIRGEEARKKGGTRSRKEERVGEMSKKGFLELVAGGGNGKQHGQGHLKES